MATNYLEQYDTLKRESGDALLLFRIGDFYELFREDAKAAAKVLGLTITTRSRDNVEMAGFPHHCVDAYLTKLVKCGFRVAVCEAVQ